MNLRCGNQKAGFSLVELLLTLVLILGLAAASVFSYTALHRTANLDEGLNRLESLIRYAQAEAATTGCKVRLQFDEPALAEDPAAPEMRSIRVTWEPDFLNSPGVFQEYTNKAWSEDIVNEIVGVTEVRPIGPPAPQYVLETDPASLPTVSPSEDDFGQSGFAPDFPGITFYPDGSCDSAQLILASRNSEDARRVEVRLSGILGSVSSRVISPAVEDDFMEDVSEEGAMDAFAPAGQDDVAGGYLSVSELSPESSSDYLQ